MPSNKQQVYRSNLNGIRSLGARKQVTRFAPLSLFCEFLVSKYYKENNVTDSVSYENLRRYFSMIYTPMGLWPRLIARLLPLAGKLLRRNCSSRSPTPSTITTWRSGVYFEWKNFDSAPHPFLLIQSGSVAYDAAVHMNESEDGLDENSNEKGGNNSGMEVVVPRSHAGLVSSCAVLVYGNITRNCEILSSMPSKAV